MSVDWAHASTVWATRRRRRARSCRSLSLQEQVRSANQNSRPPPEQEWLRGRSMLSGGTEPKQRLWAGARPLGGAEPRCPPGPGPTRAGRGRAGTGAVVGQPQARRAEPGAVPRPVPGARHLFPCRGRLTGCHHRTDRDRRGHADRGCSMTSTGGRPAARPECGPQEGVTSHCLNSLDTFRRLRRDGTTAVAVTSRGVTVSGSSTGHR